jgi:hypothetical protein
LPEKYRAPFLLCCLEGKSRAEVAETLGCKEGTLASRLATARERLQKRLTTRGVSLPTALAAVAVSPATISAGISASLTKLTVDAALTFAGSNMAGAASAQVVAVAHRVLQAMFVSKLKSGIILIFLASLTIVTVGGLMAYSGDQRPAKKLGRVSPPQFAEALSDPNTEKQVQLDAFGDPLPKGAFAQYRPELFRSIALAPAA